MAKDKQSSQPIVEPKQWTSADEIERAVAKLSKRIAELEKIDIRAAMRDDDASDKVVVSNVRETLREVFGQNSPEFQEHEHLSMWSGGLWMGMEQHEVFAAKEGGRKKMIGILKGLINRLEEKEEELSQSLTPTPKAYLEYLNLHPRIKDVAEDLFEDGYHWEAVFAAAKALVNYVKERSGQDKLDGAPLMRTVFSRNNPALRFNELKDQTDMDEQEGMMHLFEGTVLGIRNPGGHSFPEGPKQRAVEYLSLISLLAYRVQEAKRSRPTAGSV
jgi:uncharacterized protein (TIGR02391 family)